MLAGREPVPCGTAPRRARRVRDTAATVKAVSFELLRRVAFPRFPAGVQAEAQLSSEVRRGVALPHVRREGLRRPALVLGVSAEGISLPHGSGPVHLVFLLVSPADDSDGHLRSLAPLARLLSEPGREDEIVVRYAPHTPGRRD